jgi:hypothetical protein
MTTQTHTHSLSLINIPDVFFLPDASRFAQLHAQNGTVQSAIAEHYMTVVIARPRMLQELLDSLPRIPAETRKSWSEWHLATACLFFCLNNARGALLLVWVRDTCTHDQFR